MRSIFLWGVVCSLVLASCGNKGKSMKGDEQVGVAEFIAFFPEAPFPIRLADTALAGKPNESFRIGANVIAQFIPDSVWKKHLGKQAKPVFHAKARCKEDDQETYLLFTAAVQDRRIAFLAVLDKDNRFVQAMPLVRSGFEKGYHSYGMIDRKFQVTTYREETEGITLVFKRNIYVFNRDDNRFLLILSEPNEETNDAVIDPIDTLPRQQKYSGNYVSGKRDFISIRDGKGPKDFRFFIHFEKAEGSCNGELKGVARWVSDKKATYQDATHPCSIAFDFTATAVTIKETGGCGVYRDVKCFFEGTYPKKNLPLPKK